MATALEPIQQAAAIPLLAGQICVVTSRNGKRWTIPKGHLEPGKTALQIAAQEAWEEAGLLGRLEPAVVGAYQYEKCGNLYHVSVFLMEVIHVADSWPEADYRVRKWLPAEAAHAHIENLGLAELLRGTLACETHELTAV
jgi:8-oxo-dGTP pyrophosphatase MutT (NUDIX family)